LKFIHINKQNSEKNLKRKKKKAVDFHSLVVEDNVG
jgi:hypothetical protein